MRRTIGLGVAGLALVALTVLARRLARLEPVLVQGDSMRPTLRPGQRLAVGPLDRPPRRGDLVVVVVVGREGFEVVKRVVGLPGERLRLAGGRLEVDGVEVAEPYLAGSAGGDLELRLGDGQYLVLGDHRAASTDGRDFGPVPAEALAGRVRFAYWPPRRLPRPARMRADVPVRRTRGR
jgi:signal peptidase I